MDELKSHTASIERFKGSIADNNILNDQILNTHTSRNDRQLKLPTIGTGKNSHQFATNDTII